MTLPPQKGPSDAPSFLETGQATPVYRAYVLAILLVIYIFNYLDRVLGGIAAPAIRREMLLNDFQIGVINGAAFSGPYILCALLVGWFCDRTNRVRVLALALSVWAISIVSFGLGQQFIQLALARVGLGIGEAAAGVTMIPILIDYYPRRQLARALAIYGSGVPIGTSGGVIIGALLITHFGWRDAFELLGAITLLIAPLLAMTIREPRRSSIHILEALSSVTTSLGAVISNPSFLIVCAATAMSSISAFAVFFWFPSAFARTYKISLSSFALAFGTIQITGGIFGAWLGAWLADRFASITPAAYMLIPAIGSALSAVLVVSVLLAANVEISLVLLFFMTTFQALGNGPIAVAYQLTIPPSLRSTAASVFNSALVFIGMGIGLPLLGGLSDLLKSKYGNDSLDHALLTLPIFLVTSAVLFGCGAWRNHKMRPRLPVRPLNVPA